MNLKDLRNDAEGIGVAVILESEGLPDEHWTVHIINFNDHDVHSILVNSSGFGERDGQEIKTSQLRHFIENIPAQGTAAVETITPEVFDINNQYFVTYYVEKHIFDKKFIFAANSIDKENLQLIEDLNAKGIIKL